MVCVIFFSVSCGQRLYDMVARVGNRYQRYFISPSHTITVGNGAISVNVSKNTVAVVLDTTTMTIMEMDALKKALFEANLYVVDISEVELYELEKGSELRMMKFLYSYEFVLPQQNQFHLVNPLCQHAGVKPDTLPGVVSVANTVLAIKYAVGCTLWGATQLINAAVQTIQRSSQ